MAKDSIEVSEIKSGKRKRLSFARHKEIVELPYLVEIQKNTYNNFITKGIGKVLSEFSPITDYSGKADFYFGDYYFDGEPKYNEKECGIRKQTMSRALKVKCKIKVRETGREVDEDVFIADIPMQNESGAFIINGVRRVIKSQIVRSPSVYFSGTVDKTGKSLFTSKIMPKHGAWIELEQTANDVLKVVVDKQSKMSIGILLKSIGFGRDEDILKIFDNNELIKNTLEKEPQKNLEEVLMELARKLRPSDVPSVEAASKYINELFFVQARYDLKDFGRYKMDQKLSLGNRLSGQTISRDVISPDGELLAKAGADIGRELALKIQNSGINEVYVKLEGDREYKIIGNNRVDIYEWTGLTEKELNMPTNLKVYLPTLQSIYSEHKTKEKRIKAIIENKDKLISYTLTLDDIIATIAYLLDLNAGLGHIDQIDHLGNRRICAVGESMENAFRSGVIKLRQHIQEKLQIADLTEVKPSNVVSGRPVNVALKEFTAGSQLSQNMDDVNPLSTLVEKRRITAVGPGGLNKERAGMEVRDIHYTQYGRICPIETPEGENIGIVLAYANYAKLNEFGFLITPYIKVNNGTVTKDVIYLSADEEEGASIAQANEPIDETGKLLNTRIVVRRGEEVVEVPSSQVDYLDVSTKQFISSASALVPFVENDDANRVLMACSMQRQAVPLIKAEAPVIATGMERVIARDSGALVLSKTDGVVEKVDSNKITVKANDGKKYEYELIKFEKTDKKTCINQKPIVSEGEKVKAGDILADGYSCDMGELALGKDVLVAFMNWEGYNFEDAILVSDRIAKEDVFTSIYIIDVDTKAMVTKLGDEEITRDIPNVGENALKNLDENGIIKIGSHVDPGDILVGKVTPKGEVELGPEERLMRAIFGEKAKEVRDTSLRAEPGEGGTVIDVKVLSRENKDELDNGVNKLVRVYIAQKRKLSVGDKMAGRHGNKGVVSRIMPRADMPYMANGEPVDIVLNPLGVPSRMNIGQILEVHLGLIAKTLGVHVETPAFNGANEQIINKMFKENNLPENGKIRLYDGRTGDYFYNDATVGYMHMLKLDHMVDSKVAARSTGPYALVTQQPLGGKSQHGGQRLGEMEVWALEAYGASNLLQEMLTVKSDDAVGRLKMFESIVHGTQFGEAGIPESFKVMVKEFQGIGLDVTVLTEKNTQLSIDEITEMDNDFMDDDDATKKELVDVLEDKPELEPKQDGNVLSTDDIFGSGDDIFNMELGDLE